MTEGDPFKDPLGFVSTSIAKLVLNLGKDSVVSTNSG